MAIQRYTRHLHDEGLGVMAWRLGVPSIVASTASSGGGLGPRGWIINVQVPHDYGRRDIDHHISEIASTLGLDGTGVGMLTAAEIRGVTSASEAGIDVDTTVGLSHPTFAASPEVGTAHHSPGTINVTVLLPIRLDDGALLNAVMTATEAKSQALWDAGIAATGTASDAITIACPQNGDPERFCGPRSTWGARLARVVHRSVLEGALRVPS